MGDVITLVVNMNKKGFEKGCNELRGAINSMQKTAGKMGGTFKKIIPSIIGIGSAYQIITKAVGAFMAQNERLSSKMNSIWTALGNVLGPIIERVINWVTTAVSYLLSFLKLLGVTGKTASQLSKSAKGAGSDLKKTIAGFDELNVLQDNRGGGGGGVGLDDIDPKEWMKQLAELITGGQFTEAGRLLAEKLNEMVDSIDWEGIGEKAAYYFKGTIDFLANVLRDFDFHNLGKKFATSLNQILHIDSSEENTWRNLGELLAAKFTILIDTITGFLEEIDGAALAQSVSDSFIGFVDAIATSVGNADWQEIGDNLASFLANIDYIGVIESMAHGIGSLVGALFGLLVGFFDEPVMQIGEWLSQAFNSLGDMTWEGFWNGLSNAAVDLMSWVIEHIAKPFCEGLNIDWDVVTAGAEAAWEGIKGVFSTVGDFFKTTFSNAWAGVKAVFSAGGEIFVGIKEGIVNAFKGMVNGLINGINSTVAVPFQSIANAIRSLASVSFLGTHPFAFMSGWNISIPKIPLLERGGVLKKGQLGLLEGNGAEAVVPLERNTEWINKIADAFMARVSGGSYSISGNTGIQSILSDIAEAVSFKTPAIATGTVVPYGVDNPRRPGDPGSEDSGLLQELVRFSEKMDQLIFLMENMQFVADFGDDVRALAKKVTTEQRLQAIAEGL